MEIFCNSKCFFFTVSFDQFNTSMLNKSINFSFFFFTQPLIGLYIKNVYFNDFARA